MKNSYLLYILAGLAVIEMALAIRCLVRASAWEALTLLAVKDAALVVFVAYLVRLMQTAEDTKVKLLAVRSVMAMLMVSYAADAAITLLRVRL